MTFWVGIAIAVLAGIGGGAHLAGDWQDVLLFLHGHAFGTSDPVFHMDFGFYVFTLPVIDDFSALLWGGALLGFLGAAAIAALSLAMIHAPKEIEYPAPPGGAARSADDALRISALHAGVALIGIFILAALGAHFGPYHLVTEQNSQYAFVGPNATDLNVLIPVLGALQVIALLFADRHRRPAGAEEPPPAELEHGGGAGRAARRLAGGRRGAHHHPRGRLHRDRVNPNAEQAQAKSIDNYLTASRYAWDLERHRAASRACSTSPSRP